MKIQCSCGTKYAFDITPEIARGGTTFVCPQCGVDNSQMINQLIRQQVGPAPALPSAGTVAPAPTRDPVVVRVRTSAPAPLPLSSSAAEAPLPGSPRSL